MSHKNAADKVVMVISKFDYKATDSHELDIKKGEKLRLLDDSQHWWQVSNAAGQSGYIPSNYVKKAKQGLFSSLRNTLGRSKKKCSGEKSKPNGTTNPSESPAHCNSNSTENVMSRSQISISSGNNPLQRVQAIDDSDQLALTAQELAAAKPPPSVPPYHQMGDNFTFNASDTSHSLEHILMDPHTNGAVAHTSKDVSQSLLYCRAKFNYAASQSDELTVTKGDNIRVIEQSSDGWWKGQLENEGTPGPVGWFPSNYAEMIETNRLKSGLSNGALPQLGNSLSDSKEAVSRGRSASDISKGPPIGDDVLFIVVTLYPFIKNQGEELSFDANTTLHVIEQPIDDPDWWLARNSHNKVGLVPRNYLRKIDRSNSRSNSVLKLADSAQALNTSSIERPLTNQEPLNDSSPPIIHDRNDYLPGNCPQFADKPWYWGHITRNECEQMLLQSALVGEFILRDSEAHPGDFTITTLAGEKTRNFKVHLEGQLYHIGQKVFDTIDDLIQHYRTHPIFKNDQERHYLTEPFEYHE